MTAIDPKALEAAAQAIAKTGMTVKGVAEFNWEVDFAYSERSKFMVEAGAAIQTYLEHPDADLVPRSEHGEILRQAHKCIDERDEARREANESSQDLKLATDLAHGADKLWDERGKQLAALREALEDMLENFGVPDDCCLSVETARAVLTDTAKAASQYQKVPRGWAVMQIPVMEDKAPTPDPEDG